MIGDEIEIVVIDIKGDQVKLGIKAPKKITVHRKEIYDEIRQENISALNTRFKPESLRDLSDYFRGGKKEESENKTDKDDKDDKDDKNEEE
jgi:carbon storage regulator